MGIDWRASWLSGKFHYFNDCNPNQLKFTSSLLPEHKSDQQPFPIRFKRSELYSLAFVKENFDREKICTSERKYQDQVEAAYSSYLDNQGTKTGRAQAPRSSSAPSSLPDSDYGLISTSSQHGLTNWNFSISILGKLVKVQLKTKPQIQKRKIKAASHLLEKARN